MNSIKLYNGDCLELMKDIPENSIDLILCDPPYGTTQNGWDTKIQLAPMWEQYSRIIKDNGAILLFSQMPFAAEVVMSNTRMFRYEWIWHKSRGTGFYNANRMPLKAHENILVFYKKLPVYHPQWGAGKPYKAKQSGVGTNYHPPTFEGSVTESDGRRFPVDVITGGGICEQR